MIDDLSGETPEDGQTVLFALDGKAYEINLGQKHAIALREALEPFIEAGRSVSKGTQPKRSTAKSGPDLSAVRA